MTRKFLTQIVLPADPAAPMEAATKQYVDGLAGDEVWIGAAEPVNPALELWVDTDATSATPSSMALPRGYVGHAVGSTTAGIAQTVTDITGALVTWTADPTRWYKTTLVSGRLDQGTANVTYVTISDAANVSKASNSNTIPASGYGSIVVMCVESGLSGTQVRKARASTGGSATVQVTAGTFILVEDIGAV